MTKHGEPEEVKSLGSRGIWFGVAAPILGLVILIIAGALSVTWELAQRQDRLWVKQTERLVDSALAGRARALSNTIVDFGFWNDAYRKVTLRWDDAWIADNFYSAAADGLVIYHRDGDIRYTWFAENKSAPYGMIAAAATKAVASPAQLDKLGSDSDEAIQAPSGSFVFNGQLAVVSATPIMWDTIESRRAHGDPTPVDYLAGVDLISPEEIAVIGQDLGLSGLAFRAGLLSDSQAAALVWMPVHDRSGHLLGGMTWMNDRPGTHQFAKTAWPIAIGLLFSGLLAVVVTRHLVKRQLVLMARAETVLETGRLKAQFIATMSHELRTPLNAIIGYSELIHESADSDSKQDRETRADAERIKGSAHLLLRLVNEILEHAKIEAGFLPMFIERVDVGHSLNEVLDVMRPQAEALGNTIRVNVEGDDLSIMADPARLSQCLLNVAGNAVKFTKNGEIEIRARRMEKGKKQFVMFSVTDTGVGMDPAVMGRLFSPFFQGEDWQTRVHSGSGLGLSITRRLLRAMGGDIYAVSEPNKGSTFNFWLPAAMAMSRAA